MSKEQLAHIFEPSACLTIRQMKGYVAGKMVHEESHAVEVHLLSCPFCSEAVEGLKAHNNSAVIAAMEQPDTGFIADHFGVSKDELKATSSTSSGKSTSKFKTFATDASETTGNVRKLFKPIALVAGLIGVVCVLWFMKDSIFPSGTESNIAQNATIEEVTPQRQEPEIVYKPADTVTMTDTSTASEELAMLDSEQDVAAETEPEKTEEQLKEEAARKKALALKRDSLKKLKDSKLAEAKKTDITADAAVANADTRKGNSYTSEAAPTEPKKVEEKEEVKAPPPAKKKIELGTARSGILKGDEAFNDGKYKKALRQYQKVMYDPQSNQKDAATVMAAKCHIAEGEMMQARTLLNSLVSDNSAKKDEAQSLLRQLPKE